VRRALAAVLAAAALLPGCGGDRAREIEVGIRYSKFSPSAITVEEGESVRFSIENHDPIAHEFILGDDRVQLRHETGTEPSHGAVPGEVSIPAGTVRATTFTFGGPGTLVFACHLPGHFAFGMRGEVRIDPA
jgi:uncharacterized cupredoxin-like copper-binding protein